MAKLVPMGILRGQDSELPFSWACSECEYRFVLKRLPELPDPNDPLYIEELRVVQAEFENHKQHRHRVPGTPSAT
jgi:hypothetical protein